MNLDIPQIIGWVGMALFITSYILVSFKKISGDSRIFQFLNLFGSITLGISVFYQAAWPAFFLEIVWGTVATVALVRSFLVEKSILHN